MGFSIGGFLKSIAGPVIGGLVGGPFGAVLGGAIQSGFQRPPQPSFPGPTVFSALPALIPAAPGIFRAGALVAGGIAALLALSRERTGRPASARKIRESARVCGIELTAQTFQLTESEVCTIIISTGRRRARGISAADLRRTRSTLRKVHNISHDLRALAPTARRAPQHHHRSR